MGKQLEKSSLLACISVIGEALMCALLLRFREDVSCFALILLKSSAQKPCKGVAGFLLGCYDCAGFSARMLQFLLGFFS